MRDRQPELENDFLALDCGQAAPGEGGSYIHTVFGGGPLVGGFVEGIFGGSFETIGFGAIHGEQGGLAGAAEGQAGASTRPLSQGGADNRQIGRGAGDLFVGEFGI